MVKNTVGGGKGKKIARKLTTSYVFKESTRFSTNELEQYALVTKIYGNGLTGGAGVTAFTAVGLLNGETIGSVTITYGTGAAATAAVGTNTGSITPSAASGGTLNPANYNIVYMSGNLIVNPAPLTIAATLVHKPFGDGLTGGAGSTAFTSVGLQNGQTIGSVTILYGT